ncbi:hypothetical protein EZJ49_02390 [Bdellovibrio bacteriovorus]|uniref:hypothetical protein n=1 Tax=Bdellovibrio bacteriovorus TaxID=959 RepID=UPI0021CEA351|nr:hypothetical protein [Bdellovibrio bacteriovorus]UXR65095.1 hypothetical protein EZJ49_02390 [Bdellovibrio bacteriovorus]
MKKYFIVFLLLASCASKDLAIKGEPLPATDPADQSNPYKMDVSAEVIQEYSDDYNLLLQINFRSRDGKWVRVDNADFDLTNSDNEPFNIIVGKDLVSWAEAKSEEHRMNHYNKSMGVGLTALTGGALVVAGILSDSDALTALGAAAYGGAAVYSLASDIQQRKAVVQGVPKVPETHLYSPFTVPSMSLTKRWVLINVPSGRISKVANLKLKTVEGQNLQYKLTLAR